MGTIRSMDTEVSGSLITVQRAKGAVIYAKLRIDGQQKKIKLGMAHTGRDRPAPGYLSERMAQAALEDLKAEARKGSVAVQRRTNATLSDVFDAYVDHLEFEKRREATYTRGLRMGVRATLLSFFGDCAVERITTAKCEAWVRKLRKSGLADSTIRRYMIAMDACMRFAVKKYGLRANPMTGIDKPSVRASNAFNVLDPPEILKLAECASTPAYRALYTVAGFCGLRLGELRALRWKDVRWDEKAIMVRRNCPTTTNQLTTPKSGQERSVPMAEPVRAELSAWRMRSMGEGHTDADLVFPEAVGTYPAPTGNGFYFSEYRLRDAFNRTLTACGFKPMRLHDLRHSAATIFARAYPDMFKVQAIMGHSSITVTAKYYHYRSHSDDADALSAFIAKAS